MAGIARGNRDDPAKAPAIVVFAHEPQRSSGPGGLANDGDIGRVTTEGFNVFLHPLESHLAIIDAAVSVRFIARKLHKTFKAHAVTELDLDYAMARIRGTFRARVVMGAGLQTSTVDIDDCWM